ncbi:MAG TPA: hypothetical protein VKE98_15760 [Gemmataceae bacterium]|nr:hypothetical protein [Gemmataceae bacterium]
MNRILLIYEEGLRRLSANENDAADVFHQPADLVRRFVEDYHEHLEEQFIFPEFERRQHLSAFGAGAPPTAPGRAKTDRHHPPVQHCLPVPAIQFAPGTSASSAGVHSHVSAA